MNRAVLDENRMARIHAGTVTRNNQ